MVLSYFMKIIIPSGSFLRQRYDANSSLSLAVGFTCIRIEFKSRQTFRNKDQTSCSLVGTDRIKDPKLDIVKGFETNSYPIGRQFKFNSVQVKPAFDRFQ